MTRERCDGSGCLMDFDAWARRLGWIVIDPEDRKQTVRLQKALRNHVLADEIRDALRSLIEPPKPGEPTGLGAVVEDADGLRWVHRGRDYFTAWVLCDRPGIGNAKPYSEVAAVKVLSEGVQP